MNVSLFQAAAALNANSRWQESIAENLASGAVPGYKRQQLTMAATQAGLMPNGGMFGSNIPSTFVMPQATTTNNFTGGDLKATGVPMDVAIEGKGFFEVQLPGGTTGYTRDGEFQMSAQGALTTKEGYPVMGTTGPITLNPRDPTPLSISPKGDVTQGSVAKGKLILTEFGAPGALTQISANYFTAPGGSAQPRPSTATVRQNFLEGSNSSTVLEMAGLMTAMRGFEANQHVIQIQDDRLGKVISELGNPS